MASASFPIEPNRCETELGRFLAQTIHSTHSEDDASGLLLVLPATEMGLYVAEMGDRMARMRDLSHESLASLLDDLDRWTAQLRETPWTQDNEVFRLRSIMYKWPVFGSQTVAGAETPEAYFDACSRLILQTGGVIAWSGLSRTPLPEYLVSSMANGRGPELLGRFRSGPVSAPPPPISNAR